MTGPTWVIEYQTVPDEAAIRERMRKAIADQIEDDCDHNPNRVCDVCDHAAKLVRRIAVTR